MYRQRNYVQSAQPRTQSILPPTPAKMALKHDTLYFGVLVMIIYIGEINFQNSYAVSRFVDHLIDILKTACRKNLLQRW